MKYNIYFSPTGGTKKVAGMKTIRVAAAGRCRSVGESGEEAINIIKESYRVFEERLDGVIKIAVEM